VNLHALMLKTRLLEERLIQMYKQGHGFFWVGGPGEEAFNVPLGLLIRKGQGPAYDYLHAHYRQAGTIIAMGEDPIGSLRQMRNTATDPYSGGRNFSSHYSIRRWNVVPVSSPIEVQYSMAIGTALAQKRAGGEGITIATGGDAGTAEGDFASCLLWSSRPGQELPLLMVVTHNQWGISTPTDTQMACSRISDRGQAFGIRSKTVDGNDPVASYQELEEAMAYVRRERRPFLLEARVSRLYGHSSASGANRVPETVEVDCLAAYEKRLEDWGLASRSEMDGLRSKISKELADAARIVRDEPGPTAESVWDHVYAEKK
ncbi:MAG TPA: thiamine pyrophosphate-dependent dehydrogenase E1 component subunit alpha, partial [Myxococcaceae bacterium]|nr:thiamine pyrophosphate-dependent dehydrogenase E1 component subunit alpha [Myxococcaceae bacterium]